MHFNKPSNCHNYPKKKADHRQPRQIKYDSTLWRPEEYQLQHKNNSELECLRALYDSIPCICFTLKLTGVVISVSQFGAAYLGYEALELAENLVSEVFYSEDQARCQAKLTELQQQPTQISQWSVRIVAKKGNIIWVRAIARLVPGTESNPIISLGCEDITPLKQMEETLRESLELHRSGLSNIPDPVLITNNTAQSKIAQETLRQSEDKGAVVEIQSASHAITGRKQSEEALQKSEEQFRLIFELAPIGMTIVAIDGQLIRVNQAFCKTLGYTASELLNRKFVEVTHPDDIETRLTLCDQLLRGEITSFTVENRYIAKNGKIVNAILQVTLVRDANGCPLHFITQIVDITERKQAEEALRQAEKRYHSIFENSDEGIFQTTPDGRYLSANPALARIYGYKSPEELIATFTNINQQLYVDYNQRSQFLALIQAHDRVSNFASQVYRKDGSIIWISENAHVVRDEAGEVHYYEGSVVDVTERKVWEEALRYQQECTDELLLNILPQPIAQRLKMAENPIADSFASVTVLFADLVNFTEISAQIPPTKLVDLLNKIFSEFDRLAQNNGLEKIKTIGDAYMVVGGLPMPRGDHTQAIAEMALDMQREITRFQRDNGEPFCLRIGIHTGPVVAGVIGMKKFSYDLWGDTVNVASRMESQGVALKIQVTAATYERLKDKYLFEERGAIAVKGKGEMITYWLTRRKVSKP